MKNFKTQEIIDVLLKNKNSIILATIIAGACAYAASFLIKPKYKSIAVVYPLNLTPGSEESNTEQLIQYFNSEEIKYAVAEQFDLYSHYKIDRKDPLVKNYLGLMYKENVSVSPTLYESINLEVLDTDPVMAQKLNYAIIKRTDSLIMAIKRKNISDYISNYQNQLTKTEHVIDSLLKCEQNLRKTYKIMDHRAMSKAVAKLLVKGDKLSAIQDTILTGLFIKYPELTEIYRRMETEKGIREFLKKELDKNKLDYNSKLSFCNVVSSPSLPDKKASPVRLVIVISAMLSVFALASIFFIYLSIRGNSKDAE